MSIALEWLLYAKINGRIYVVKTWCLVKELYIPCGNLLAASGPLSFFCFLPTLVGTGGSYFLRLSLNGLNKFYSMLGLIIFLKSA